jgi:hypothetical protein
MYEARLMCEISNHKKEWLPFVKYLISFAQIS